jgi:branched-chain amino acid transport system substrate-binding protein
MNLIVRVAVVALVCCLGVPARAAGAPYEINVIASLTGPGAYIGKQDVDSLGALERLVNRQGGVRGTPIHFVFLDDQTNPQVSVQLANQIISKNVPIIMGPTITSTCRAVTPLVAQNGPLMYCLTPGVDPAKGGYQFSASISTRDYLSTFFAYARKRGLNRIAVLTSIDATGQVADDQITELAAKPEFKGLELVAREHFNNTDVSVAAQVSRIKASRPDVLVAWTTGPPLGTVLSGLQQSGFEAPVFTSTANQTHEQMKQYASLLPKELLFASLIYTTGGVASKNRTALNAFYQACREMGIKPDLQAGFAWDPALIVVDALKHVGLGASALQLRTYIEGLSGFMGIAGGYDFRGGDNRGVTATDTSMMRWDASKDNWIPLR